MQNLLFRRYQAAMLRKKAGGGFMDGIGTATQIGSGIIDAVSQPDQYGFQSSGAVIGKSVLGDAATGAQLGSVIPGVGPVIGAGAGALVGLGTGLLGANKQKKQENDIRSRMAIQQRMNETNLSNATLGANPNLVTGSGTTYFSEGGSIHIKPSHRGRFTEYLKSHHTTLSAALHSKSAHVRQMANFANNAKHWHHKDLGGSIGPDGSWLPVDWGHDIGSKPRTPLNDMIASGGTAKKLSSNNALITGNSHEQGGVKIPELDTEVEGGESTLNNFVFSKKLGFADLHIPIAKAKGKIEQKPRTLERATSMRLLAQKEQTLMQQQEALKQQAR
jgi:hypothetical protein